MNYNSNRGTNMNIIILFTKQHIIITDLLVNAQIITLDNIDPIQLMNGFTFWQPTYNNYYIIILSKLDYSGLIIFIGQSRC